MAYATTNPPRLMLQPIATRKFWYYESADAKATVDASGYFTNGYDLGMRDGDFCLVYDTVNKLFSGHTVLNASAKVIDLADGVNLTSVTNTD